MKLLILGATGATGKHLLELALADGHEVTALVRDAAKLTTTGPKLRVVSGRATVADELAPAVAGQDAVISAIGPRASADPVCVETAQALIPAMKQHGVKRLVWLSAGGVGDSKPQIIAASFVFGRIIMPLFLRKPYAHHATAEDAIRASGLDYTVVRPLQLVDQATGRAAIAVPIGADKPAGLKIARRDVAAFMLREATAREHVGKMPLLHA